MFLEEQGLLQSLMGNYGMAVEMPHTDFYEGEWASYILKARGLKEAGPRFEIAVDGGDVSADAVESLVQFGNFDKVRHLEWKYPNE
jgi:hypothetical protein